MRMLATTTLCLALAACASISLPDEAADFASSSARFTGALRQAEPDRLDSKDESERAVAEGLLVRGEPLLYRTDCLQTLAPLVKAFDEASGRSPYDADAADRAFEGLRQASPCSLEPLPLPPAPMRTKGSTFRSAAVESGVIASAGADTLAGSAAALDDYVAAVVDVVANDTGSKREAASRELAATGGTLLEASGLKGGAAATGFVAEFIAAAVAAERNARLGAMLAAYDRLMPYVMERVGHAGRLVAEQTLRNRTQAAYLRAVNANLLLADRTSSPTQRLLAYGATAPAIEEQNRAILRLRAADPMQAARAFASAHRDLTAAFNGPEGRATAQNEGLRSFRVAAAGLAEALGGE